MPDLAPDLGPHAAFIIAAYGIAAIIVAALILHAILDYRAQRRALAALDGRGLRGRPGPGPHRQAKPARGRTP